MVGHFFSVIAPDHYMIKFDLLFGQSGVVLFFVLSGFLITRILLNTKGSKNYFKNFFIRRSLRILPLYYIFLLIHYYLAPLILKTEIPNFSLQIYHYLFLQDFAMTFNWLYSGPGHFWSLAVEEHSYLFWPFVIIITPKKQLLKVILSIIVISILIRALMLNYNYNGYFFTFTRFDALAIGAILSLLELRYRFSHKYLSRYIILLIGILIPSVLMWTMFSGSGNNTIQIFKYLVIGFTFFSIIGMVLSIKDKSVINKILESRFFRYSGKISYGLYVYHPLIFLILLKYCNTHILLLNFVICFSLTYLISTLSYRYFENPFLKLKKYFVYNK